MTPQNLHGSHRTSRNLQSNYPSHSPILSPDTDFRIKFLKVLIIKSETHEIEVEQEEALRALLHYESYPDEHTLEDIVMFCENALNNSKQSVGKKPINESHLTEGR